MKLPKTPIVLWFVAVGGVLSPTRGAAQATVSVSFATTNSTPLNAGFAGFATETLNTGLEYDNTNFQQLAASLSPGWLRYPGGISDDAFNWTNGLTDTNWMNVIGAHGDSTASNSCQFTYLPLLGKGGAQFTNFASLAANVGGARIIVCVNCFTDTNNSAGAFAAFALSNHIAVAAWELCNEPYLFTGPTNFFTNGADYATKMLPYRNAIKAADSNAVVAVFFSDPAVGGHIWDNALINYSNRYWDAVSYHFYPQPGLTNFSDLMAYDNGVLLGNTTSYVTNYLMNNNNTNVTFMITEFQPVQGSGAGTSNQHPNVPSTTLYGGIYASEFVMRMSTVPQMKFVGNYQLFNENGIGATNVFRQAVVNAANGHYVTNTQNLPFGFYLSAQATAQAVAYWAVNRSTAVYTTTVDTNGPTVPANTNYNATMPAIYAQAYQGSNGKRYVVLTNKGATNATVQLTQDGVVLTNQFLETYVTGPDPSLTNSSPPPNNVQIQSQLTNNPVVIPQYSVVRLEWAVFTVPRPTLSLSFSNSAEVLQWTGLTNVTYAVQATTNLASRWSTLGLVSSTQSNFAFTNWSTGALKFYRLVVP
ncbi:MAG TPA: hypothetical protein VN578_06965 [Candidatus Binatia bacterium]|nr:hypothetical protein [Candidatus Binatia bacterium]